MITSRARYVSADDCLVYRVIHTPQDHDILLQDLSNLTVWARDWHMEFNVFKCSILQVTTKQHISTYEYTMNGTTLNIVSQHPCLGITLDHKLSWHSHIETLCHKANRTLGFLKHNIYNLPRHLHERSYKQLVLPMLHYCSSIWDPYHHNAIKQLEMIQHWQSCTVCHKQPMAKRPPRRYYRNPKLANSTRLTQNNRLILLFKLVNNLLIVPHQYFLSPFFPNTRANHQLKFSHYQSRTEIYRNSFFSKTTIEWNSLPYPDLDEIDAADTFRSYLFT